MFKTGLDRQREEIAAEAFGVISQSLTKVIQTLVGLFDNRGERLKRLTAKEKRLDSRKR